MTGTSKRDILQAVWWAGVQRVAGDTSVKQALNRHPDFVPTHLIAIGKAAANMAGAALDAFATQSIKGLVVTKYDHGDPRLEHQTGIELIESAHPVPDENSLSGGERALSFVEGCDAESRLLVLVSGGASALVEALPEDWTLDGLKAETNRMLAQGLDIHAINKRRKEISLIKDGKLLARFGGRDALVLAISDVEGDDIGVIGSGIGRLPSGVASDRFMTEIVASNAIARDASHSYCQAAGLPVVDNQERLYGEVGAVAELIFELIDESPSGVSIFGGEPVVHLPDNPGEGGRNQALAVHMARLIAGRPDLQLLVAGTDGSDGPTVSAGGFADGELWRLHPGGDEAILRADCGHWLREAGALFVTGPTGTNVMDLMIVLKD